MKYKREKGNEIKPVIGRMQMYIVSICQEAKRLEKQWSDTVHREGGRDIFYTQLFIMYIQLCS